jgi:hypothetical protein
VDTFFRSAVFVFMALSVDVIRLPIAAAPFVSPEASSSAFFFLSSSRLFSRPLISVSILPRFKLIYYLKLSLSSSRAYLVLSRACPVSLTDYSCAPRSSFAAAASAWALLKACYFSVVSIILFFNCSSYVFEAERSSSAIFNFSSFSLICRKIFYKDCIWP